MEDYSQWCLQSPSAFSITSVSSISKDTSFQLELINGMVRFLNHLMDMALTTAFSGVRWILPGNRHERDTPNHTHIFTSLAF
jgi:hypothetical protein